MTSASYDGGEANMGVVGNGASVIRILDPVGIAEEKKTEAVVERVKRPHQRPQLDGAVIGVLTNLFRGYDVPGGVADRIKRLNAVADVIHHSKPSISRPAGDDAYDRLVAAGIDAAVIGLGG
jgi:hypothetical protein